MENVKLWGLPLAPTAEKEEATEESEQARGRLGNEIAFEHDLGDLHAVGIAETALVLVEIGKEDHVGCVGSFIGEFYGFEVRSQGAVSSGVNAGRQINRAVGDEGEIAKGEGAYSEDGVASPKFEATRGALLGIIGIVKGDGGGNRNAVGGGDHDPGVLLTKVEVLLAHTIDGALGQFGPGPIIPGLIEAHASNYKIWTHKLAAKHGVACDALRSSRRKDQDSIARGSKAHAQGRGQGENRELDHDKIEEFEPYSEEILGNHLPSGKCILKVLAEKPKPAISARSPDASDILNLKDGSSHRSPTSRCRKQGAAHATGCKGAGGTVRSGGWCGLAPCVWWTVGITAL